MDAGLRVLRLIAFDGRPSLSLVAINKRNDRAFVFCLAPFSFVSRFIRPLSNVAGVRVMKRERMNGKTEYGISLQVFRGDDAKFGCHSREQAMNIMHKLSHHLGLANRHGA